MQIVPGSENGVAIELISTHIRRQLNERSNQFRQKMAVPRLSGLSPPHCRLEELDLIVLSQTRQLKVERLTRPLMCFGSLTQCRTGHDYYYSRHHYTSTRFHLFC